MYDNVFQLRNKMDKEIYDEIFLQNIYQLPDDMSGWAFIDIGAHIGAASYRALLNGCKYIVAVDALWCNFYQLKINMDRCGAEALADISVCWYAVVGNTNPAQYLYLSPFNDEQEGNQSTVWWKQSNRSIETITLRELIRRIPKTAPVTQKIMIKIDVEGSEYDILMHSNLSPVDMIVGEVHEVPAEVWRDGIKRTKEKLFSHLTSVGFNVSITKQIDEQLTIFKAER